MPFSFSNTGSTALREARGPAAEDGGDLVVDQQLLGLLGEGRPVAGAVFLDDLDLAAEHAAHGVDLVDGELLGLDRAGLADRHGAGGGVQLADGDWCPVTASPVVLTLAVGGLSWAVAVAAARARQATFRKWWLNDFIFMVWSRCVAVVVKPVSGGSTTGSWLHRLCHVERRELKSIHDGLCRRVGVIEGRAGFGTRFAAAKS